MQDTILLRALGLPSATATLIGGLQGKNLKALLSRIDSFAETSNLVQVILVGCDLVAEKLAISSRMVTVANYLAQAKRYFEKPGLAVSVWWPSSEEIHRLESLRRLRSGELIVKLLMQSSELRDVDEFLDPSKLPEQGVTFASTLEDVLKAEADSRLHSYSDCFAEKVREASKKYMQRVDSGVFEPLVQSAMNSRDPSLRAVRLQVAHVCKMLLQATLGVHTAQARSAEAIGGDQINFLPDASWKCFQALTDTMTKLIREEMRIRKDKPGW
jgi:hypothetical protein